MAGAPIDTSAGNGPAQKLMPLVIPRGNMALYKAMVAAYGGIVPGINSVLGSIAADPATHVAEYLKVYRHVRYRAYLDGFRDFYDWYLFLPIIGGLARTAIGRVRKRARARTRGSSPVGASGLAYEVRHFAGQCDALAMAGTMDVEAASDWHGRLVSAEDAVSVVRPGDKVFAAPRVPLPGALWGRWNDSGCR